MERISGRQLILIGIAFTLDSTLVNVPSQVIEAARMDAWLSLLAAALVLTLTMWLISKVMDRYPGKDLFEVMIGAVPFVGKGLALLYTAFFMFILARDVRMIVDFTNITLLPKTPIMLISILIVFTVFIIARGGVEILARMTEIWLPVFIVTIFIMPVTLFRDFDVSYLQPMFAGGIAKPAFEGGWYLVAYIGEVTALPLIFANNAYKFKYGFKALWFGTGLLLLIHYYIILVLGIKFPLRVLYPTYELVRQIRVTDFLDRLDLPLVGIYLPAMITKIAYSLYIVCHGLKRVFPQLSAKQLTMPFAMLAYVCSYWFFSNAVQLTAFNRVWPFIALLYVFVIPLLLFAAARKRIEIEHIGGV